MVIPRAAKAVLITLFPFWEIASISFFLYWKKTPLHLSLKKCGNQEDLLLYHCQDLKDFNTTNTFRFVMNRYYVKRVRIRSYSGPYFPALGLNTERYPISLRIQSECGKIQTRMTSNTDTFHVVRIFERSWRNVLTSRTRTW